MTTCADKAVEAAFRAEWGRVVATLIKTTGDWDLAEECAQEAFAQAVRSWPDAGVPSRPGAWLTTVARNRALDRLRRAAVETAKLREVAAMSTATPGGELEDDVPDERLRLIFTCCHPALPLDGRVALTLRTLAGLTTGEIARAFLVPEPTMAKRLVRAKKKIRAAAIPYRVPPESLLPERTAGVLAVVYLLFNEGYSASAGADLIRRDLCTEALRLARLLVALMPDDPEVLGLAALLLLQDARRDARLDEDGELITLDRQDRTRWDQAEITEGRVLLERALSRSSVGQYQLQAAIAACHSSAPAAADTDWALIDLLYRQLGELTNSPVVQLNRSVAIGMADGPAAGLRHLDAVNATGALSGYYLLPATRGELLRRLGQDDAAVEAFREALALAPTDTERRFLARQVQQITDRT
jgi:RNA polymerase sigma-70 factor, ECF subfamily